jgi:hypothetical protein
MRSPERSRQETLRLGRSVMATQRPKSIHEKPMASENPDEDELDRENDGNSAVVKRLQQPKEILF